MINRRSRAAVLIVSVATALILAACGSSSPPATTTTSTVAPASTTTTSLAGGGTASAPACSTALLEASAVFGGTAAGSTYTTVSLKNTGPKACSLDGYPKYSFFAPSAAGGAGEGDAVAVTTVNGGPSPSPVTINSGDSADSILVYSDIGDCATIASAQLTPPGTRESISFPLSISPCGGSVKAYAFGPSGSESP